MTIRKDISSFLGFSFLALAISTSVQGQVEVDTVAAQADAVVEEAQADVDAQADTVANDVQATVDAQADVFVNDVQAGVSSDGAQADASIKEVQSRVLENLPGIQITSLETTQVPGLYELITDGQIYYVDKTANFLVDGSLIRLSDRANLTEARQGIIHAGLIEEIGEDNMLIFEPAEPSNRFITVFTDISCGFCRRLHGEIETLLEAGVRVRYLMFPRAGLNTPAAKDLESVWCADDPQAAMTNAKAGGKIEPKTCDTPIESHVALAQRLGLRGTPLIYTDSGVKIPGYREASDLVDIINNTTPLTAN